MVHGRINEIVFDEKSCRPVILDFENGELDGKVSNFACGIFQNEQGQLVPAITSDKIIYTTKIDREEDFHHNFLAIRNKRTNQIRLVSLDTAVMMALPVKLRKVDLNRTTDSKNVSIQELQKKFGSKKSQRMTEQSEKLKVNVEAIREHLEKTVADINVEEDFAHSSGASNSNGYLPPLHEDADVLTKVYLLKDLIPLSIFKSLDEQAQKLLDAEDEEIKTVDFVKREFDKLKASNKENKLHIAKVLLLVDCLIRLATANAKVISQRTYSPCDYSKTVSQFILQNFTLSTDRSRSRPLSMKQKTVCYILVLGMLISDYRINLDEYAVALKQGAKKLQEVAKVMRFTQSKAGKNVMELVVPLPPVVTSKQATKRAKK